MYVRLVLRWFSVFPALTEPICSETDWNRLLTQFQLLATRLRFTMEQLQNLIQAFRTIAPDGMSSAVTAQHLKLSDHALGMTQGLSMSTHFSES